MLLTMSHMEFPVALIPGGIGSWELLFIFFLILVLFGPSRMSSIARKMGQLLKELRSAAKVFQQNLLEMDDDGGPQDDEASKEISEEKRRNHGSSR